MPMVAQTVLILMLLTIITLLAITLRMKATQGKVKATGKSIYLIPGKFEAENSADSHPGVKTEL